MKYEEFKTKVNKVNKVNKTLFRFRILVFAFLGAIVTVVMTLYSTKGLITSETKFTQRIFEYGETFEYGATGFLVPEDGMKYEFCSSDGDWSETVPTHPGSYSYRPYNYNNYGVKICGTEQAFVINPKTASITISSDSIEYGEKPEVSYVGLINGDTVTSYNIIYEGFGSVDSPIASIDLNSIKVESKDGDDMSDCYTFSSTSKAITIKKKSIIMTMNSISRIYDGTALVDDSEKSATLESDLLEGDYIYRYPTNFVTEATPKSENEIQVLKPGEYVNTVKDNGNMIIKNKDDVDVTRYYDLKINDGKFVITKRKLVLEYEDLYKIYDGECLNPKTPTFDSSSLAYGDVLTYENEPKLGYKVGNGTYKYTPVIKNSNNEDVTDCYEISNDGGSWKISERNIDISVICDEGKEIFASDYINSTDSKLSGLQYILKSNEAQTDLSSSLGKNDIFINSTYFKKDGNKFSVDKSKSEIKIEHTLDDGTNEDVTSCYSFVNVDYSNITINKKEVDITYYFEDKTYDGEKAKLYKTFEADNVQVTCDEPSYIDATDDDETPSASMFNTKLISNGKDVTDYYDLNITIFPVKIKKRPITITFGSNSGKYGTTLNGKFKFTTYDSTNSKGLLEGHVVKILNKSNGNEVGSSDSTIGADNYYKLNELTLDKAGSITFGNSDDAYTSLRAEIYDSNGNIVTNNYEITYSKDASLSLSKRTLTITFGDYIHYYDGSAFNPLELTDETTKNYTITGDDLAVDDNIKVIYKSGVEKLTGNEYFTNDNLESESVVEKKYDLNDYFDVVIENSKYSYSSMTNSGGVTDSYNLSVYFGTLTIRRVQMIVESDSEINSEKYSTFYGSKKGFNGNEDGLFQDSETSDYQPNDLSNKLAQLYTRNEKYSLTGSVDSKKTVNEKLEIIPTNYDLKIKDDYKQRFGYDNIPVSKIHFKFKNVNFKYVTIKQRTFEFSLKSTKFYINETNSFEPGSIDDTLSDGSNEYSPYNILTETESTVDDEIDSGEGLAENDRLVFEWKDGKVPNKVDDAVYQLSDYLTWHIENDDKEDVTSCYKDNNGNTLVSGDTQWYSTATLTYKIPIIAIKSTGLIKLEKNYDGNPLFDPDTCTDENGKNIFSVDAEATGVDFPNMEATDKCEVKVKLSNQSLSSKAGTFTLYINDIVEISFISGNTTYKKKYSESHTYDLKVLGKEDAEILSVKINPVMLSLSIDNVKLKYNSSCNDDQRKGSTDAYYDGYKWGLTLDDNKKDENGTHYLKLNISGLPSGYEFKLINKNSDLPCLSSSDSYDWSDYYTYKIVKKINGQSDLDVTSNFEFEKGKGLSNLEFNIRKISFRFSFSLKDNYYWYSKDENQQDTSESFTPDFKYEEDISEEATDVYPDDFDNKKEVSFVNDESCRLDTIKNNISTPNIKSITYGFNVGNIKSKTIWSPDGDDNTMDLTDKTKVKTYNVKKRKLKITFESNEINKCIFKENQKVTISESDLKIQDSNGLRDCDNITIKDIELSDTKIGSKDIDISTIADSVIINDNVGVDVTSNYDITIVNSSMRVKFEKPSLEIEFRSVSKVYDGKSRSIQFYTPMVVCSDGTKISDIKIQNLNFKNSYLSVGTYQDDNIEIESLSIRFNTNDESFEFTKDDFKEVKLINTSSTLSITKRNYTVTCNNFTFKKKNLSNDINASFKVYIKENFSKLIKINSLGYGDSVDDFDVYIEDLGNGKYEYYIVPTSITHNNSINVTDCYNDFSSGCEYISGKITVYPSSNF